MKKFLIVLLSAMMVLGLAACGSDKKDEQTGNDNPYADDACEFLNQFRFYIQGDGHPFPANFSDENRNGLLLSNEMRRIYSEIRGRFKKDEI